MDEGLIRLVWERALNKCEYCHVPQPFSFLPFEIDHIIARKHHGKTVLGNLALSCAYDNSFKGSNIAGIDPRTGRLTRLFHPRRNKWSHHFHWDGPVLTGRTAIGRTTIDVLAINHPLTSPQDRTFSYSHLAGEYFGAAELSKRGYSVALTVGNAKAIDLFAEKGLNTVNVQVKTISLRRNVGWPMLRATVFDGIIYVMVCLNDYGTPPTFFIARGDEIRDMISEYDCKGGFRGILNYGKMNSEEFRARWDKVEAALKRAV